MQMHSQVAGVTRQGLLSAQVALRPVAASDAITLLRPVFKATPYLTVVHLSCDFEWDLDAEPVPSRKRRLVIDSRFDPAVLKGAVITTAFGAPVPLLRCDSAEDVALDFNSAAEDSPWAKQLAEVLDIGHAYVEAKVSVFALLSLDREHLKDLFRFS